MSGVEAMHNLRGACVVIDWRDVDGQLRSLAVRRSALDAEEARLLRAAEQLQIWRPLGMVSALDYMERVLGYAPHTAMERLRVARALEALPVLEAALEEGRLHYSAVRELTRVATPSTEAKWCERAIGKNVRQIEELVAGHALGDDPDDPVNPEVQRHKVTLDLSAEVYARWRQTQTVVTEERGGRADDDAFATELLEARLERGTGGPTGRAKFQIMMTICKHCERGWQEGSGVQVPVDTAAVERAKCDAQYVGSTDDKLPVRASQDIPPSIVRFVWRRDGGKCTTPGCRSACGLEIHHKRPRAVGGTHDPDNLCLTCGSCHRATHRGTLEVVDSEVRRPNEPSHVGSPAPSPRRDACDVATGRSPSAVPAQRREAGDAVSSFEVAATRAQARDALVALGWKPAIARGAVDDAISHVGSEPIEVVIREALRRCPRPS